MDSFKVLHQVVYIYIYIYIYTYIAFFLEIKQLNE